MISQVYPSGVSRELALARKSQVKNINYKLFFSIPDSLKDDIIGSVTIDFENIHTNKDLVIDFQNDSLKILALIANNKFKSYRFVNEHIIIPSKFLKKGKNTVSIQFVSGNSPFNRSENYLYTLFVPDKASIAFPCFDQPDLKATFELELSVPKKWLALSNARISKQNAARGKINFKFEKTKLISTYLFAFAAGEFKKASKIKNGRILNFYHRETDTLKLKNNIDSIFNIHFAAIEWMEKYTGIPYAFDKLDFIAIPSFQFSGMEHVGAIFYRNSRLFLSKSATIEDIVKRAMVISHEVSHMWFGDLVTMKWFDDVWLKEVYAELLASKMVKPLFPDMDHDLNFVVSNFPRAYQTDGSIGTNPIKQKLENLKFAGTLYGDIIYFKAPIVMAKLERLIGEEALQEGLRDYLKQYRFGNASWDDLIKIFNQKTQIDLESWSRTWVEQEGMPIISSKIEYDKDGFIKSFTIVQEDAFKKERLWRQNIEVLFCKNGNIKRFTIFIDSASTNFTRAVGIEKPDFILLNGDGYGYGYFILDSISQEYLLNHVNEIDNNFIRTISYITLNQALINYKLDSKKFVRILSCTLATEKEKQNIQLMLDYLQKSWWYYLSQEERIKMSTSIENCLFEFIKNEKNNEIKAAAFQTLVSIFISEYAQNRLYNIWKTQQGIDGLKLSENDYSTIAIELSLRNFPGSDAILKEQLLRIKDEDLKKKMIFVMPSVSIDENVRDGFFESLKKPENRQQELWVRTGLYYLNHPLRAQYSIKYLKASLEMLEEIQKTGDIFFPKNWLAYTVGRYNNAEAAKIVTTFLREHPDYNTNLKAKILQLSDMLFKAEKILDRRDVYGIESPVFDEED
ncbi:MAG: M1 family aminopeptidase [Bacteroidales bacterium]